MKLQEMITNQSWHTMHARKVLTLEFSTKEYHNYVKNKTSFSNLNNTNRLITLRYQELTQLRNKKRQKVGQVWTTWKSYKVPLFSKLKKHNLKMIFKKKGPLKNICNHKQSILIIQWLVTIMMNLYPPRGLLIEIAKMILTYHVRK